MAFSLMTLSANLKTKVGRLRFGTEKSGSPPHVTILRRGKPWRWKLREQEFMDKTPNPSDVREELIEEILNNYEPLCNEWDKMYPGNPIRGDYDDEGS